MQFCKKSLQNGFPINKTLVENGLTVAFKCTCSFSCEELPLGFYSLVLFKKKHDITAKERSFYLQATCLTYIDFTYVVFSWDHEPMISMWDSLGNLEYSFSQKYHRQTASVLIRI